MKRKNLSNLTLYAYAALILSTAIWGGALPVIKITESYIPPFTFLLFRFILVCLLMLPVIILGVKTNPVHPKDIKNLMLLGLFGQGSLALIFIGVNYTSSIDTAIIGTIAPLLVIFAGHYFYHEKVNLLTKVGIAVATVGTLLVVLEPIMAGATEGGDTKTRLYGNLLVLLYNMCFAVYILYAKVVMGKSTHNIKSFLRHLNVEPMRKAYSPMFSTAVTFYAGLAVTIPLALMEHAGVFGPKTFEFGMLTIEPVLGILYMAVLSSIVAYVSYEWGLKYAGVSDSAIFGYLGPLFTLPFSYILLKEVPSELALVGSFIITIGVVIAEKYKNKLS